MNFNINSAAAKSYEPAQNAEKTRKTGKHESQHEAAHNPNVPKGKKDGITPEDTLDISEAAQSAEKTKGRGKGEWKNFDMDAFQGSIRNALMQTIHEAKGALKAAGVEFAKYNSDSILYDLSALNKGEEVKAADVPEYWNAENTSQRMIDFAMSFRGLAPELSDEEYIEQMRAAVEKGFKLAKKDLGDLPGPSAKLFNDTYNLAMKKFDELLEQAAAKNATSAEQVTEETKKSVMETIKESLKETEKGNA